MDILFDPQTVVECRFSDDPHIAVSAPEAVVIGGVQFYLLARSHSGSFGRVHEYVCGSSTQRTSTNGASFPSTVVLKILPRDSDKQYEAGIVRELEKTWFRDLKGDCLVRSRVVLSTELFDIILMEHMHGSIERLVADYARDKICLLEVMADITRACCALLDAGWVYADLKASNCLYNVLRSTYRLQLKLSDIGSLVRVRGKHGAAAAPPTRAVIPTFPDLRQSNDAKLRSGTPASETDITWGLTVVFLQLSAVPVHELAYNRFYDWLEDTVSKTRPIVYDGKARVYLSDWEKRHFEILPSLYFCLKEQTSVRSTLMLLECHAKIAAL